MLVGGTDDSVERDMNVVELNLAEPPVRAAVLALQREAFGTFSEDLFAHIIDQSAQNTITYGIYEGPVLAAVTQFIAHSVCRNGVTGTAYQACGVATKPSSVGKGYFSSIVDFAKDDLREKGGAFIFGFPNKAAKRVWVDKKGFSLSANVSTLIFRTPVGVIGSYDPERLSSALLSENLITFDYREAAAWKNMRHGKALFQYEELTNYIFGKIVSRRKFGLGFKVFVVGGLEINKPHQTTRFFTKTMKASRTSALRIVSNATGPLAKAARFRRGSDLTEPTISFSLGWDVDAADIEAIGGLKDVY